MKTACVATLVPEVFLEIFLPVRESGRGKGSSKAKTKKFQVKFMGPGYLRDKHFRASPSRKLTRCEIEERRGRGRGALPAPSLPLRFLQFFFLFFALFCFVLLSFYPGFQRLFFSSEIPDRSPYFIYSQTSGARVFSFQLWASKSIGNAGYEGNIEGYSRLLWFCIKQS